MQEHGHDFFPPSMPLSTEHQCSENSVLAVDETVFDFFLVDVFEDVRSVDEDTQRSTDRHGKEDRRRRIIRTNLQNTQKQRRRTTDRVSSLVQKSERSLVRHKMNGIVVAVMFLCDGWIIVK